MKWYRWAPLLAVALATVLMLSGSGLVLSGAAEPEQPMLSHDVFFTLKQDSPEARARLVAACKKYLSQHPGIVWFAAGGLAEEFQRDVNDRDFDVALHLVFESKAAHDKYQDSDAHHKFIEETKETWEKVRVFDSYVEASSHGEIAMERPRPKKPGDRKETREERPERKRTAKEAKID